METKKITLTQVARYTTKKDGSPLMGKNGKPYTSVRIKAQEYGDQWLSGFGNAENAKWQGNEQVELIVEKKGEYLNFSMPKKEDKIADELNQQATKVGRLRFQMDILWAEYQKRNGLTDGVDVDDTIDFPEPTEEELNEAGIGM